MLCGIIIIWDSKIFSCSAAVIGSFIIPIKLSFVSNGFFFGYLWFMACMIFHIENIFGMKF